MHSPIQQVNKKPSLRESWWDIGFEGNGGVKSKETRVCNSMGKCHSPTFSPFVAILRVLNIKDYDIFPYYYRPLFPCFLHHHCLQILYLTNFLIGKVFYLLVSFILSMLNTFIGLLFRWPRLVLQGTLSIPVSHSLRHASRFRSLPITLPFSGPFLLGSL